MPSFRTNVGISATTKLTDSTNKVRSTKYNKNAHNDVGNKSPGKGQLGRLRLKRKHLTFVVPPLLVLVTVLSTLLSASFHNNFLYSLGQNDNAMETISMIALEEKVVEVSVLIRTNKKSGAHAKVLPSVFHQTQSGFEIFLIENGCFNETANVPADVLSTVSYQHIRLCGNPDNAAKNNTAAALASPTSKYFLLLHDDFVLDESDFIHHMLQLAKAKENAAAIGCKVLNADGSELVDAGSIIWENGNTTDIGHGRKDHNASEFSYPKPVDYVSGMCLLVERKVLEQFDDFDGNNFLGESDGDKNLDLQLHIQHELGKEVWFQPRAVGRYDEPASYDNEGGTNATQVTKRRLSTKWQQVLEGNYLEEPEQDMDEKEKDQVLFRAADSRTKNSETASILYIDERPPNKAMGSGFGRSFDNLSMISELGHRITMITANTNNEDWCEDECIDKIARLGIEYITSSEQRDKLFENRVGFYDIVLISRPTTLLKHIKLLRKFYRQSPFSVVYDCEALWFRRNELLTDLVKTKKIPFPGYIKAWMGNLDRSTELALTGMANTVVSVSKQEQKIMKILLPESNNITNIGHVMDIDREKVTNAHFNDRNGILFVASFGNNTYYNGDAIWYFLKNVYPLVVEESKSYYPIPLTIAGRQIPARLYNTAMENKKIRKHVTFVESPTTVDRLYEKNRLFIAPHLYGAGIQYKVSEALSVGLPVVMSTLTKESFGEVPGCVGSDNKSFTKCIIDLHDNETQWEALRNEGFSYIQKTHNRKDAMKEWSKIIYDNLNKDLEVANHKIFDDQKLLGPDEEVDEIPMQVQQVSLKYWQDNVCSNFTDPICEELFVISDLKASFCSADKAASLILKTFFHKASENIVVPEGSKYGVLQANWTKFADLEENARKKTLTSPGWTNVFVWKNVVERFVSEYFVKVVNDCKRFLSGKKNRSAMQFYTKRYGFSCENHRLFEAFVSFMETVPGLKPNFQSQTSICSNERYPYTQTVNAADKSLWTGLKAFSVRIGIEYPLEDDVEYSERIRKKTMAKMVRVFRGKHYLVKRILNLYKKDCEIIPAACNVDALMAALDYDIKHPKKKKKPKKRSGKMY